jgi:membrane protease YdiL (CAAX protease family)
MTDIYRKPQIESNWWRLVLYLFLVFIIALLFFIPFAPFFLDLMQEGRRDVLDNSIAYTTAMQFVNVAGVVGASWLMIKGIEYRTFSFYRFIFEGKSLLNGFTIGAIIMVVFAFLVYLLGIIEFTYVGFSIKLLVGLFIYLFVAIGEEALVRGYILTNLQERIAPFFALLFSSFFFGFIHVGNDHFTWVGFATILLGGFLMGLLTLKTNSISAAIGLHWSWNFVQGSVLGFAVSGHQEFGILRPTPRSSDLLTGGKFGAEGSLLLVILSLLTIGLGCYFFADRKLFFGSKRDFANPEFSEVK